MIDLWAASLTDLLKAGGFVGVVVCVGGAAYYMKRHIKSRVVVDTSKNSEMPLAKEWQTGNIFPSPIEETQPTVPPVPAGVNEKTNLKQLVNEKFAREFDRGHFQGRVPLRATISSEGYADIEIKDAASEANLFLVFGDVPPEEPPTPPRPDPEQEPEAEQ